MVACNPPLLSKAESYSALWIEHILWTHSSAGSRVGCFQLLTIVNTATMDIHGQDFVCSCLQLFAVRVPRSGIAAT